MIAYPVRLVPVSNQRVRVVFPDLPQASVEGEDEEDALYRAGFMLDMCLGHLVARGERPPPPSRAEGLLVVATSKFDPDHCRQPEG